MKLYRVFESVFGRFYHPVIRFLRENRYKPSDIKAFLSIYLFGSSGISEKSSKKRIFYDVTYLSRCERFAGICRVVSKIQEFLPQVQDEYNLVPVIGKQYIGFFELSTNRPVKASSEDIFFSAEVTQGIFDTNKRYFHLLKKAGCKVYFFCHDLIPVLYPQYQGSSKFVKFYEKYLQVLSSADGVICNSASVLNEFKGYLNSHPSRYQNPELKTGFTHLGVEFNSPEKVKTFQNSGSLTFLMVSTVEVRKKYDQAVEAFNILWEKGYDINLHIVGKYGWQAEKARNLIETNKYYGTKLKWFNSGISDQELQDEYASCDAVIFASMTEGFGLALVEASFYKKPLIIRDIPIFREIAGENALYFTGEDGFSLADKISQWIELYKHEKQPKSEGIKYIDWKTCVGNVYEFIKQ